MSNELQANENRHVINSFMNYIHECLYEVKNFGYDTKDIYVVYDLLRYELVSLK